MTDTFPHNEFAGKPLLERVSTELGWRKSELQQLTRELARVNTENARLRVQMNTQAAEYEIEIDDLRSQLRNR